MRAGMTLLEVLVVAGLLALLAGVSMGLAKPAQRTPPASRVVAWQYQIRDAARQRGGLVLECDNLHWRVRTSAGIVEDERLLPPAGCTLLSPTGEALTAIRFDGDGFSEPFSCRLAAKEGLLVVDPLVGTVVPAGGRP